MRPCQKLLKQEGTARRIESMQQSSAIPKTDVGRGLWKIVAYSQSSSQCLLVSIVFGTVSSLHPTSFLHLFHSFFSHKYSQGRVGSQARDRSRGIARAQLAGRTCYIERKAVHAP